MQTLTVPLRPAPHGTFTRHAVGVAPCVLIVDDDPTVAEVVAAYLQRAGFSAIMAGDGPTAVAQDAEHNPDLIVLDLMIPGFDGLEVCRRVRARRPGVAVMMVTALGQESDRIAGLETGADDYVVKPFSPRELVLRVQSVLRRSANRSDGPLTDADLVLDPGSRRAWRGGAALPLTSREFDLLAFLMSKPGFAFTRGDLLQQVWGWSFGDESTVTVHVRRLREKIEADPAQPVRIATVWGHGYRWDPAS